MYFLGTLCVVPLRAEFMMARAARTKRNVFLVPTIDNNIGCIHLCSRFRVSLAMRKKGGGRLPGPRVRGRPPKRRGRRPQRRYDHHVDAGEPKAPGAANPNNDANMVNDANDSEDDCFVFATGKKTVVNKVDAGGPTALAAAKLNDDANMVNDEDERDDDSFGQVAPKKVRRTCVDSNGCGSVLCYKCYP